MVRRADRPLQSVRVSFETTRFSSQHLVDAYACVVPMVRRAGLRAAGNKTRPRITVATVTKRRGER